MRSTDAMLAEGGLGRFTKKMPWRSEWGELCVSRDIERSCGSSLATSSSPGRTQMLRWMLRWKLRGLLWRKEWPSVSSTLVSLFVAVKQNSKGKTLWRDVSPERCLLRSSMRSCGSSLATSSSPAKLVCFGGRSGLP